MELPEKIFDESVFSTVRDIRLRNDAYVDKLTRESEKVVKEYSTVTWYNVWNIWKFKRLFKRHGEILRELHQCQAISNFAILVLDQEIELINAYKADLKARGII